MRNSTTLSKTSLGGTKNGKVTLLCEACGKKYEAPNGFGLHVCNSCMTKGPPSEKKSAFMKPKAVMCHICGREFFESSLKIHVPQCLKKRALQQSKLPQELRTPLIVNNIDRNATIEQQNEQAYQAYQKSLKPCPTCGRTFSGVDRLEVHQRSCRPGSSAKPLQKRNMTSAGNPITWAQPSPLKPDIEEQPMSRPQIGAPSSGTLRGGTASGPVKTVSSSPFKSDSGTLRGGGSGTLRGGNASGPVKTVSSSYKPEPVKSSTLPSNIRKPAARGANRMSVTFSDGGAFAAPVDDGLVPCGQCGRRFNSDRISKHESVCLGPESQKPKQEIAKPVAKPKPKGIPKWKRQHEEFQAALKMNKAIKKAEDTGGPMPAFVRSDPNPDYIQCPYCSRRFAPLAADRHIPRCQNTINKPKPPPKESQISASQQEFRARTANTSPGKRVSFDARLAGGPSKAIPAMCSCGYRFPSASTKFCGLCGKKRFF